MDLIAQYRSASLLHRLRLNIPTTALPPAPTPLWSVASTHSRRPFVRSEPAADVAGSEEDEVIVAGPPPLRNAAPEVRQAASRPHTRCRPPRSSFHGRSSQNAAPGPSRAAIAESRVTLQPSRHTLPL